MKRLTFFLLIALHAPFWAQYQDDYEITQADIDQKQHATDPEAPGEILFHLVKDEIDWSVDNSPNLLREEKFVYKIYDLERFPEALKNITIPLYKDGSTREVVQRFKATVYYNNGGKLEEVKTKKSDLIEEEVNENFEKKIAAIEGLKDQAIVEVSYEIRSPFVQHIDRVFVQRDIPVRFSQYFIWFHNQFNYSVDLRGSSSPEYTDGKRQVGQTDYSYRMYTYKDVPAHYERPFMFNSNNARVSIHHVLAQYAQPNGIIKNFAVSWEDVIRELMKAESFGGQLKSFSTLKETAATIYSETDSDVEKIKKIFDWTKEKITWNGDYGKYAQNGLRKTLRNKEGNMGDKNLLLVMLLREAGFKAYPLVFRTVPLGKLNYAFPTSTDLNAVLATVKLDENTIFMDTTAKYSNLNVLPDRDLNFYGFQITGDNTFNEMYLINQIPSQDKDYLSYTLSEDGAVAKGVYRNVFGHYYSMMMSEVLEKSGTDITDYFQNRFDIQVSNAQKKSGKNGFKLLLSCDFEKETPVEKIGGKWVLNPMLFLQASSQNYAKQEEKRTYPLEFETPYMREKIISVTLPAGRTIKELPEEKTFSVADIMSYKLSFKLEKNKLIVKTEESLYASFLDAELYEEVMEFKKNIVNSEDVAIVLSEI